VLGSIYLDLYVFIYKRSALLDVVCCDLHLSRRRSTSLLAPPGWRSQWWRGAVLFGQDRVIKTLACRVEITPATAQLLNIPAIFELARVMEGLCKGYTDVASAGAN